MPREPSMTERHLPDVSASVSRATIELAVS